MLGDILLTGLLTLCLPMLAVGSDGSELLSDLLSPQYPRNHN
jgi:hypothetical protein